MNRLNHSLIAFLAVIVAIVTLGVISTQVPCASGADHQGVLSALAALTTLAAVFRPSTQQGGSSDGTNQAAP